MMKSRERGSTMFYRRVRLLLLVVLSVALAGCQSDFLAPKSYTLSGRVTIAGDDVGIEGVTIFLSGIGISGTVTTDEDGNWSNGGLTRIVTVTPTKAGWDFSPRNLVANSQCSSVDFQGNAILGEIIWQGYFVFDSDTQTITSYQGPPNVRNLVIPSMIEGVVVKHIGEFLLGYYETYIRRITIPDSVLTIGEFAFYDLPLSEITIGADVIIKGDSALGWDSEEFISVYNSGGKQAGTYIFDIPARTWIKQ